MSMSGAQLINLSWQRLTYVKTLVNSTVSHSYPPRFPEYWETFLAF
jgi:hypothetical protein